MQTHGHGLLIAALMPLCVLAGPVLAQTPADEPKIADFSVETRVRVASDRRVAGISDTLRRPGAELHAEAAHASGLVGIAELGSVSKKLFPGGEGAAVLLAGGYRWGDVEAWHFGLGAAHENFLGAKVKDAPTGFDGTFTPTGVRDFDFNTSYAVVEFGYAAIEARYLQVVSQDFRGANTASVCGTLLTELSDPTAALDCYARGNVGSRGTQLLEVNYKRSLNGSTSLLLHGGLKRIKNFSEADMTDWSVGVQHKRWGLDWSADIVMANTDTPELYRGHDGSEVRQLDATALVLGVSYTF